MRRAKKGEQENKLEASSQSWGNAFCQLFPVISFAHTSQQHVPLPIKEFCLPKQQTIQLAPLK